jgi:integrase
MATKRKPKKFTPKEVMIHGRKLWQIYIGSEVRKRPDGREIRVPMRKTFADRNEANQYAELLRIQRTNHGSQAMTISARLRSEAIEADALLRPFGISVLEAAKEIAGRQAALSASRNTADAIRDYIQSAINDGRAKRYIEDLQSRLGRFAQRFGNTPLAGITTSDIDNWLHGLGIGAVSRNSYRRRLVALFNYGIDRGWCPGNLATKTTIAKEKPAPIGILTPDEFSRLLATANETTLPYHLLAGFAGIRSAELERLEWKDIHWDSGLIEISANKAKTAARRFVHMQPALKSWLEPYRSHRGPICPATGRRLYKLLVADRTQAGILEWPSNALRHSFASYYLAAFKNPSELSLEMGHTSPGLLFRHYRELVTPDAAAKWWSIMPSSQNNIVAIA